MVTIDLPYELLGVATILFFIYLAQSGQDLFIKDARGRQTTSDRSAGTQASAKKPMLEQSIKLLLRVVKASITGIWDILTLLTTIMPPSTAVRGLWMVLKYVVTLLAEVVFGTVRILGMAYNLLMENFIQSVNVHEAANEMSQRSPSSTGSKSPNKPSSLPKIRWPETLKWPRSPLQSPFSAFSPRSEVEHFDFDFIDSQTRRNNEDAQSGTDIVESIK